MSQGPTGGLAGFLAALDKLPPYEGITFRGLDPGAVAPTSVAVVAGVMASSRNVRVATENFTSTEVFALLNRTGRDISALSAHSDEAEVVVRPGSLWRPLMTVELVSPAVRVHFLEELEVSGASRLPESWGSDLEDVRSRVMRAIQVSAAREPVEVHIPGKFSGPWVTQLPDAQ